METLAAPRTVCNADFQLDSLTRRLVHRDRGLHGLQLLAAFQEARSEIMSAVPLREGAAVRLARAIGDYKRGVRMPFTAPRRQGAWR